MIDYLAEQYTAFCKYLGINFCIPFIILAVIIDVSYYPYLKTKKIIRNLSTTQKIILLHALMANIFIFWAYFSGRCALLTQ
jgi:hypothetical protein